MPDGSAVSKKTKAGPISADRLKSFVETMRKIVSLRSMDAADRAEQETLLDTYKHALGIV
jgi:hypothetical protein